MYRDKFPSTVKFGVCAEDTNLGTFSLGDLQFLHCSHVDSWAEDGDLIATYQLIKIEKATKPGIVFSEVE